MSPGTIVTVSESSLHLQDPEELFDTNTHVFGKFQVGPCIVMTTRCIDTAWGKELALELMDAYGKTGWTASRAVNALPMFHTEGLSRPCP